MEDKKSLIPLKRSRDGEQSNRASSITGSSGRKLIVRKDKISEVDLGHKTTNSSQGSQQGLVIRPSEMLSSVKPVSVVFPGKFVIKNLTIENANIFFFKERHVII